MCEKEEIWDHVLYNAPHELVCVVCVWEGESSNIYTFHVLGSYSI